MPPSCPGEGVGWYRKTFTLEKSDTARRVYFDFDGVMAFPKAISMAGWPATDETAELRSGEVRNDQFN
jgi:hypothetical protein